MSGRMLRALLFVAILSVFAADFTVGCGQAYVYGPVSQKLRAAADTGDWLITVNGETYDVPLVFYNEVNVGDTVKFDGRNWTVVKRAETTTAPVQAPAPKAP